MKFFSTIAVLAVIAQCSEGHQMLRAGASKTVDFNEVSGSNVDDVAAKKHKPHDGSWDGKRPDGSWGGHPPRHPKGGRRPHGPPPGSFDGSFPGPHGKWPGSFDGSFKGHGKWGKVPFPGKGKGGKGMKSNGSDETQQQQTTQQEDDSDAE
ncbi:hypothetical protein PHMEG_0008520 [Phytophthora megakarya]|uniref:Secreted protein n=1 Tax=Phytophthora megakarya TaxID=4795 RepID=A0A225WIY4_9STRA|nr:hypothetical protein PHMEG_0008520 [Phytophthora megakarya]